MHATDIIAWTNGDGCIYCVDCKPDDNALTEQPTPVFAAHFNEVTGDVCDGCLMWVVES